jgi:hypothetical protein
MHGKGVFTWSDGRKYFILLIDMMESILMIKNKDMENLFGLTENNIE